MEAGAFRGRPRRAFAVVVLDAAAFALARAAFCCAVFPLIIRSPPAPVLPAHREPVRCVPPLDRKSVV